MPLRHKLKNSLVVWIEKESFYEITLKDGKFRVEEPLLRDW